MFAYCKNTLSWYRVLGKWNNYLVKIRLTPRDDFRHPTKWGTDVAPVVFHMEMKFKETRRGEEAINNLPTNIRNRMNQFLGNELTEFLLTEDFLSYVDPKEIRAKNINGVPLYQVLKFAR